MKLTEKIAYLQGLMAGMELDDSTKEGKVLKQVAEVLSEVGCYVDDLQDQIDELFELTEELDHDLGDVEELIYDDCDCDCDCCDDDCDCDCDCDYDDEDEYEMDELDDEDFLYEVVCPTCGDSIVLDEALLEEGEIKCPNCGEQLEFDYDDMDELDALDASETEE